jgi:hypothetical protein
MSKRGKEKKADNVEKRKLQTEEALECQAIKQVAERQLLTVPKKAPKQCTFQHCLKFFDSACTVCPYCGHPLDKESAVPAVWPSVLA